MDLNEQIEHTVTGVLNKKPVLSPKQLIAIGTGAVFVLVGMFLTAITVTYDPPGGSALVNGHRFAAFTESISGWTLATTSRFTRLEPALFGLLTIAGVGLIRLWSEVGTGNAARFLTFGPVRALLSRKSAHLLDLIHAFIHVIIAFTWMASLGIAVAWGTVTMPPNGRPGILQEMGKNPGGPVRVHDPTVPIATGTPHLHGALGIGFWLLSIGIVVGGIAVIKKVGIVLVTLVVTMPILYLVDRSLYTWLAHLIGF